MVSRSENDRQIVGFSHLNGGPHGRRATRRVCRAFVPAPVATPGRKKNKQVDLSGESMGILMV